MSLINEALKKAQRLRTEEAADHSGAASTVSNRSARRGKGHGANTMVLIGSGALVLVVLSVVFTVYLVNRPAKPAPTIAAASDPKPGTTGSAPVVSEPASSAIIAPRITPPVTPPSVPEPVAAASAPSTGLQSTPLSAAPQSPGNTAGVSPVAATPATMAQPTPAATTPAAPVAAAPTTPPTLAPDAPDERVASFVDAIRVTGIRSSGAESRVLMNERVYRVNDIVERTLGVRLVKAAADSLTFSDSRGVTYVKQF